jgi:hypothetical protein
MTALWIIAFVVAGLLAAGGCAALWYALYSRSIDIWIESWLRQRWRRERQPDGPIDVLICIADHFEPSWGDPSDAVADERVAAWVRDYPIALGEFRDSDGRPPRHTFFYPIDQYVPHHVDAIAALCREGYGEIEIHLHHDRDTAENLERTIRAFTCRFAERHGVLGRHADGSIAYGFVHGNWALDNARSDGRWCGVTNELSVLRRTGCYADFTLPSAPDRTQTRTINSIYYATGCAHRAKAHDTGVRAGTTPPSRDALMIIQGPLSLWWPRGARHPRIENGCIQRGQAPSMARLDEWIRASVRVPTRPDWYFVKLHTHGATEPNRSVLLGEAMRRFHADLARRAASDGRFRYHYVTAREMHNLARAAEAGWNGTVADALDWAIASPSARVARTAAVLSESTD